MRVESMMRWALPALLGIAVSGCQEHPPVAADTSAAPLPNSAPARDWEALALRLASGDFAMREAAQQELDAITPYDRAALVRLTDAVSDAEARARLSARIAAIDTQLAIDPPPISLHVKLATNEEVAAALGKATGEDIQIYQQSRDLFTLSADHQPWWEIYRGLSAQHSLGLRMAYFELGDLPRILARGDQAKLVRQGGFTIVAAVVPFEENPFPSGKNIGQPPLPENMRRLTVLCQMVPDPRIRLLEMRAPGMRTIADEHGNPLWSTPQVEERSLVAVEQRIATQRVELIVPRDPGYRSVTIRGEMQAVVQISEYRQEIQNIDQHKGEVFHVGPRSIVVERFDAVAKAAVVGSAPDRYSVNLSIRATGPNDPESSSARVECIWVEGDGSRSRFIGRADLGAGMDSPKPVYPMKLIVSVPKKTTVVTVPFELRGVGLP